MMITPLKNRVVWTIASSDSCGGAGIQADLKTMNSFGVHGCSVIVALTAQNSFKVQSVEAASTSIIHDQISTLRKDSIPRAIKIGLLPNIEIIEEVANSIADLDCYVVADPVLTATSGDPLLKHDCLSAYQKKLFPKIDLLTPNIPELEAITKINIRNEHDIEIAARALLEKNVKAVLVKGGHHGGKFSQDYYTNGNHHFWLTSPKKAVTCHGTGCVLSSAIAACIALGYSEADSITVAKAYINEAIKNCYTPGEGAAFLKHSPWPVCADSFPWLTNTSYHGIAPRTPFPDDGDAMLGFYPIVDRATWVEKLIAVGTTTIQLRIKDLQGDALEQEIATATNIARDTQCRLYINDFWQLAIKHHAYGIHLGQEDLQSADISAIHKSGLRLGISTHSYYEAAYAHTFWPSYIALGPIFPTTCKSMAFSPQGIDKAGEWVKLFHYPVVAIGGLCAEHIPPLIKTGVQGLAVISDILKDEHPLEHAKKWISTIQQSLVCDKSKGSV